MKSDVLHFSNHLYETLEQARAGIGVGKIGKLKINNT